MKFICIMKLFRNITQSFNSFNKSTIYIYNLKLVTFIFLEKLWIPLRTAIMVYIIICFWTWKLYWFLKSIGYILWQNLGNIFSNFYANNNLQFSRMFWLSNIQYVIKVWFSFNNKLQGQPKIKHDLRGQWRSLKVTRLS